jgi:dipeptidyl aminopeptidase/acylaminoacyl peptidase
MRVQNLMFRLMVLLFVSWSVAFGRSFETIEIGNGTLSFGKPVWSPNGERLAFWGPGGIYVCKWDGSEQPQKIFDTSGENLMWASDSELVHWQRQSWEEKQEGKKPKRMEKDFIRLVDLKGKEEIITEGNNLKAPNKLPDGTVIFAGQSGYEIIREGKLGKDALKKQFGVTSHYPPVYDSRIGGPKYEDTDIWIASLDGNFKKRVTIGKQYVTPQLSPDGQRIMVVDGNSDALILDLDGNVLASLGTGAVKVAPRLFAAGDFETWSPDSKMIAYCLGVSDGHDYVSFDLYVVSADGTNRIQLTDTANEFEVDPSWSPDATRIAFRAEKSGNVSVIKLK